MLSRSRAPHPAPLPAAARPPGRIPQRTDSPLCGIVLIIASTVFLACSDALAKYLTRELPPIEIAWIRFAVFALIMLPTTLWPFGRDNNVLRTRRPGLQILRGLGLTCSTLFFIWGLRYLPIAETSATAFVAPMFVTCLSIVMLAEKVGIRRWLATIVGLLGVLIVIRPGTSAFQPAAIFPIVSALGWSFALVLTRQISGVDRPATTMTYSALVGFVVLTALVPFVWIAPTPQQLLIAVVIGAASTAGHWIIVIAYRYADASVLAPLAYSQLIWVTILGLVMFGDFPDGWTLIGTAIIIASGLYIAHRERVRRIQARAHPSGA